MGAGKIWSDKEIKYLYENWEEKTDKEIAIYLKRPIDGVSAKRKSLKLIRDKHKYSFDDVVNEIKKKDYILVSNSNDYFDSATKTIKYICPKHSDKGVQLISLGHLQTGRGCYYCGRERTENARRFDLSDTLRYEKLCEQKGFLYQSVYRKNGNIYISYICKKHKEKGIQTMQYQNMKRDSICGCPFCFMSSGEKAVMDTLDSLSIVYKEQYRFSDLADATHLRFDYYLPYQNKAIEYDGIQHFQPIRFNGISQEQANKNFEITQKHDKMKNDYCKQNGIPLLRIPFFNYENIDKLVKEFLII